jgi:ATP-binding cassette subfamily B protein
VPVLLLVWIVLTIALVTAYWSRCTSWSRSRLTMTDDLVERMTGQRTRLAQEPPAHWHDQEDRLLADYVENSRRADAFVPWFSALLPRGWLVAGMIGVGYTFTAGAAGPDRLAVLVGIVLIAFRAFRKFGMGAPLLVQAAISWRVAAPIVHAADRPEAPTSPALARAASTLPDHRVLVEARELTFRYPHRAEAVLHGCALRIRAGDRIVLDGPSGGGKSTLASIMAGLRKPTSGVLLAGGMDRASVGADGWRRRVAMAPQFHENHLITGSLAFNLLMGRPGIITETDVQEAATLCVELGLGDLLERMPAGIMQLVGEGGWQLSHGERSRVFLARALLQNASLIVLDECFAALDGVNLQRALRCVEKRAPAVLAIAHA